MTLPTLSGPQLAATLMAVAMGLWLVGNVTARIVLRVLEGRVQDELEAWGQMKKRVSEMPTKQGWDDYGKSMEELRSNVREIRETQRLGLLNHSKDISELKKDRDDHEKRIRILEQRREFLNLSQGRGGA